MTTHPDPHAQRIAEIAARILGRIDLNIPQDENDLLHLLARVRELEALSAEGRKAGRAEAAAILMGLDAEQFDQNAVLTEGYSIGDTGDYGARWVPEKVLALFDAGESTVTSLLERADADYWTVVGAHAETEYALTAALARAERAEGEVAQREDRIVKTELERDAYKESAEKSGLAIHERRQQALLAERERDTACIARGKAETALAAALARAERAEGERDQLIQEYCEALGYEPDDKSFVHVLLHISNAIKNRKADVAVANYERDTLRTERDAALAELAGLGPERRECGENPDEWHMCRIYHEGCANKYKRTIRVVQPKDRQPGRECECATSNYENPNCPIHGRSAYQ